MTGNKKIALVVYLIAIFGTLVLILSFFTQYMAWGMLFWDDGKTNMDIVDRNINIYGFSCLAAIVLEGFLVYRFYRFLRRLRAKGAGPST